MASNPGVNHGLRSPTTPGPRGWAEAAKPALSCSGLRHQEVPDQCPGGLQPRHSETRAPCRARATRPVGAPTLNRRSAGFRAPGPAGSRPTPSTAPLLGSAWARRGSAGKEGRREGAAGGGRGRRGPGPVSAHGPGARSGKRSSGARAGAALHRTPSESVRGAAGVAGQWRARGLRAQLGGNGASTGSWRPACRRAGRALRERALRARLGPRPREGLWGNR